MPAPPLRWRPPADEPPLRLKPKPEAPAKPKPEPKPTATATTKAKPRARPQPQPQPRPQPRHQAAPRRHHPARPRPPQPPRPQLEARAEAARQQFRRKRTRRGSSLVYVLATVVALGLLTVVAFAITTHSQGRHAAPAAPALSQQSTAPNGAATPSTAATASTRTATALQLSALSKPVHYLHQTDMFVDYLTLSNSDAQRMVNADLDFVRDATGVGFHAASTASPGIVAIYRLHNHTTGDYVYTATTTERNSLTHAGYVNEGAVFYAPTTPTPGLSPAFRLQRGLYHRIAFGIPARNDAVAAGWHLERAVFYARR